MQHSSHKIML